MTPRTFLLTGVVLVAFAGNSLLCRAALAAGDVDPVTFTAVRVASGGLVLLPWLRGGRWSPRGAAALLAYALGFSLAYTRLDAGTGALLLFGAVQGTMIGAGLLHGERPSALGWTGIVAAAAGLVLLVAPGVRAPDPGAAAFMVSAGIAWGLYSLLGRGVPRPTAATARNFALATPFALAALLAAPGELVASPAGLGLAVASGALTSGLGYALWYATLRGHTATSAAVVQLAVPVIAAAGGVLLLGEAATPRLMLAGGLTLAGVGTALVAR